MERKEDAQTPTHQIKFQMTLPQKRRQSVKLTSSQTGIFCAALLLRQLCRYVPVDADTQKLEFIKASNLDQCQKGCWLLAYGLHLCDGGAQGTSDRIHLGSLPPPVISLSSAVPGSWGE